MCCRALQYLKEKCCAFFLSGEVEAHMVRMDEYIS
jgi:hypothetical protein